VVCGAPLSSSPDFVAAGSKAPRAKGRDLFSLQQQVVFCSFSQLHPPSPLPLSSRCASPSSPPSHVPSCWASRPFWLLPPAISPRELELVRSSPDESASPRGHHRTCLLADRTAFSAISQAQYNAFSEASKLTTLAYCVPLILPPFKCEC
jgi:hypothetical protein